MINRIVIVSVLAFIGFLAYGQGAHAFAPLECPCNETIIGEEPGITGAELLDMICPGGELAQGGNVIFSNNEISVSTKDPFKSYFVEDNSNGRPLLICGIGYQENSRIRRVNEEDYQLCRQNIINSCGLSRPVPTMSEWGLVAMAGLIGIIGSFAVRRRVAAS